METILTGILAVVVGIAATIVLTYGTDALLRKMKFMGKDLPKTGGRNLIIVLIAYRTLYNILGCYVAAELAPSHPMTYALGIGAFGLLASIGGALNVASIGPKWYNWALVLLALPAAFIGGLIATM
jgi:hypothetical protein